VGMSDVHGSPTTSELTRELPRLSAALVRDVAAAGPGAGSFAAPSLSARIPSYDRAAMAGGVVHLGVGGFHRAHLALYLDDLLEKGVDRWSITGSGVMPHDERIAQVLNDQDGLYLLVEREGPHVNGRVIGSIGSMVSAHNDSVALLKLLSDASTKIVSLTITESGYPVDHGEFVSSDPLVADIRAEVPRTTFGIVMAALDARRKAGLAPFTVMSCDNLPGNGHVARIAVEGAAELRGGGLRSWISTNGAFPNGMVDRITPATTDADRDWVREHFGFVDGWPVVCEPFRQWALEDMFVEGRPRFEEVGVLMTNDVIPYEHMKLRLLNGSHSGLAYHAALAGFTYVHDAVLDRRIEAFIRTLMKDEAAPNLVSPAGIDLAEYQNELVRRFSNPAIADTIARLCMDGTSKFPTFIVPSLEDQLKKNGPIRMLALVLAGWCRYLRGIADDGSPITLSHDPFLAEAVDAAKRSEHDPREFLGYEKGLGPNLAHSTRLLETFIEALDDLAKHGSLQTLQMWTGQTS
jgi:mannitol 2-dehydrogenase